MCPKHQTQLLIHTKLLTIIFESPLPAEGPLGTPVLTVPRAALVFFLMPPIGATVALVGLGARRPPRPPRRADFRRVLRISSRDWSSFSDMFKDGCKRYVTRVDSSRFELKRAAVLGCHGLRRWKWSGWLWIEARNSLMANGEDVIWFLEFDMLTSPQPK